MRATPTNDNGKDTKNNAMTGGKFTLSGLGESSKPAPVETPAHDELLQIVTDEATPFDFVEAYYRAQEKDPDSNYISGLREKAKGSTPEAREAAQKLLTIEKAIKQDDYAVLVNKHLVETFDNYRFCSHGGLVFAYNGAYWQQVADSLFSQMLGKTAEKYGVPGLIPERVKFRKLLLGQFHETADHPKPATATLVNLNNGTLRIDQRGNAVLGAFDWQEFVRYQLPYDYNPEATAPKFQSFLDEVVPDKNMQNIIFEYLGRCFLPGMKADDKILMFYGQGQNGKGVLLSVIAELFGTQNVSYVKLDSLTGDDYVTKAAGMDGKLLNIDLEVVANKVNPSRLKQYGSYEPIQARHLYNEPFEMIPPPTIASMNKLPQGENTFGYIRRFQLILFDVTIPPEKKNINLASELIETELPGFLNLVLEGARRLIRNKGQYTANPKGDERVKRMMTANDNVAAFLEDCFQNELELPTGYNGTKIYKVYCQYIEVVNRKEGGRNTFLDRLTDAFKIQRQSGGERLYIFPHPLKPEWATRYYNVQ